MDLLIMHEFTNFQIKMIYFFPLYPNYKTCNISDIDLIYLDE